jgi:hypothetical protein
LKCAGVSKYQIWTQKPGRRYKGAALFARVDRVPGTRVLRFHGQEIFGAPIAMKRFVILVMRLQARQKPVKPPAYYFST